MTDPVTPDPLAAMDLFDRSYEGRCSNPSCPSQHIDFALDCVDFARANLRAALAARPVPDSGAHREYAEILNAEIGRLKGLLRAALADTDAGKSVINLHAPEPGLTEEALDVDRLALALIPVTRSLYPKDDIDGWRREQAAKIAAEYSRLREGADHD